MYSSIAVKCIPITSFVGKTTLQSRFTLIKEAPTLVFKRNVTQGSTRTSGLRGARVKGPSLKEQAMAPAGQSAFRVGQGLVAGASAVALGGLCYYGLGLSNEVGTIEKASMWPEEVKKRVRDTYLYFGGSLCITAASAVAVMRSPALLNMMAKNSWMALIGTVGAMIGSGMLCRSIPYQPGFGSKQLAWILHSGVIGAVIAPLTFMGGPLVIRAAFYTAGIVGGMSTLAICAPSEKFLNMGGPLAMGLGAVFMASIGTWFLPATSALGAGLYSIAMYGGLVVFSGFLLYDTQKIMKRAETHPSWTMIPYDPVNESVGIYMDTINIFIRVLMMLMGNNRKR